MKKWIFISLIFSAFLFPSIYTRSDVGSSWTSSGVWLEGGYPNSDDAEIVIDVTSSTKVIYDDPDIFNKITLKNDFTMTCSSDVQPSQKLIMEGVNPQIIFDGADLKFICGAYNLYGVGPTEYPPLSLKNDLTIDFQNNAATIDYPFTGSVGVLYSNSQLETVELTKASNYSGESIIDNSIISVKINNALPEGKSVQLINSGQLLIGANQSLSYINGTSGCVIDIEDGYTLSVLGDNMYSFAGTITGDGKLQKNGSNDLILTGQLDGFYGQTIINDGNFVIGNDGVDYIYHSLTSGAGTLKKDGSNTVTLTAIQLFTGGLDISEGKFNINATVPLSIKGEIKGTGILAKTGSEDLTIKGEINSFTGDTDIQSGLLKIGNSDADQTYSGNIIGTGDFMKSGSNKLTLLGTNTYTGGTNIEGGNLAVNGSLDNTSLVVVNTGATLSGSGTIGASCEVDGSISPGNSIETLNITGNVDLFSGSSFIVELNNTESDLLNVDGNVTIFQDATIEFVPFRDTYSINTIYTAIDATGVVNNQFSSVVYPSGYSIKALYDEADKVKFQILLAPLSPFFGNGNAGIMALYLDRLDPLTESDDLHVVLYNLQSLSDESAKEDALDQMQPAIFKAFPLLEQNNIYKVRKAANERLKALYMTKCSRNIDHKRSNIWFSPNTTFYYQRNYSDLVGFDANTISTLLGYDYGFENNITLGALIGYERSHIKWHKNRGKGDIDSYYLGSYLNWNNNFYYVEGSLIGGFNKNYTTRNIKFTGVDRTAKGDFTSRELLAHLSNGFIFTGTKDIEIRPFISFDYEYMHTNLFHERNANSLNLKVRKANNYFLKAEGGFNFSRCFTFYNQKLIPDAGISYIREIRASHNKKINASLMEYRKRFTVYGIAPNRSMLGISGALNYLFSNDMANLSLIYNGEIGRHVDDHTLYLNFKWRY